MSLSLELGEAYLPSFPAEISSASSLELGLLFLRSYVRSFCFSNSWMMFLARLALVTISFLERARSEGPWVESLLEAAVFASSCLA